MNRSTKPARPTNCPGGESTTGPSTKGGELGVLAVPDIGGADARRGAMNVKQKPKEKLSREERDQQYAMSTTERGGYDVVFMQVI